MNGRRKNIWFVEWLKDLFWIFSNEYRQILSNPGVLLVFFGGVIGYGLLYNYMYGPNTLDRVPVAVVDGSKDVLSRKYIRMLDATKYIDVTTTSLTFEEAREMLYRRKVQGIVVIPSDFEVDIARSERSTIQVFCSMNSFLYYVQIAQAANYCSLELGAEIRLQSLPGGDIAPIHILGMPLYNQDDGYGNFLVPIAMVLVLHQTLILGIGMMAGSERERNRYRILTPVSRKTRGLFRVVMGKAICYFSLYFVLSIFILGFVPKLFHLPDLARLGDIIVFIVPFLSATIFFGMALSVLFKSYESPLLIFVFSSIPLLFLSGISFPLDNMPWIWKIFHYLLPAPVASVGFVRLGTMGASIHQIGEQIAALWIQTAVYFLIAVFAYYRNIRNSQREAR